MVKRSRHRRPLLPPLPLRLHSFRFGFRVPMEGRAGQIIQRPVSSMVNNVSELEKGSSSSSPSQQQRHRCYAVVTPRPRRTSQTLTSSEVKSTPMSSDKCEIPRLDSQHIGLVRPFQEDAAALVGGPGDIADHRNVVVDSLIEAKVTTTAQAASKSETTHTHGAGGPSSSPPPLDLLDYSDEFKSLGTDRLLPCDLDNIHGLEQYKAYLEWFYNFHKGPGPAASVASVGRAAFQCLEKENNMRVWWNHKETFSFVSDFLLGECIADVMYSAVQERDEFLPFGVDAAPCIAKEAELIVEWLKKRGPLLTYEEYALCHKIRGVAYKLFVFQGEWSIYIAAALLGIRKEAEWLIENLRLGSVESISTSMKIRRSALHFISAVASLEVDPMFI